MTLVRTCVAVGAAGALLLGLPAHAAAPTYKSKKLTLTDDAGDGNAINGQGFEDIGNQSTPVQNAGADILKVEYASTGTMVKRGRTYVPVCNGFTVKLTLAAAPAASHIYRLTGTSLNNDGLWWIQYDGTATIRYGTADESSNLEDHQIDLSTPAKVDGNTVTFVVKEADVKATGEKLASFRIDNPGAHDRLSAVVVTAPEWDELADYEGTFKPC